jgi:hypothetical protein
MPIRLDDITKYGAPISFLKEGEVLVRVGPCSAKSFQEKKIPLDGRHYCCSGTVIFKNGVKLRANFEINTHTFDFLDRESVHVFINAERAWYSLDEDKLYDILLISKDQALPFTWIPDIPLDYHVQGPYPMNFYSNETK